MSSGYGDGVDTEAGMLPGISRKRSIRSNPYWFTEFCNSQCLSHFAAPFIVVRAETSVAESCDRKTTLALVTETNELDRGTWTRRPSRECEATQARLAPGEGCPRGSRRGPMTKDSPPHPPGPSLKRCTWSGWIRANDPSAGSPTETLLRLLLPLSDKVH